MKAMVLCAGLGTRLRPLTEEVPKPALPLFGRPLFRSTLATLRQGGVRAVGINTHHLPAVMKAVAETETHRAQVELTLVHEPVIQGTGGGIRGLRAMLVQGDVFVVFNGDVLFPLELAPVVAEHRARNAAASMVLLPMPANEKYAAVECAGDHAVRRIAGHGPGGVGLTPWHFTGVHVMTRAVFDFMTASGPEDINREVYPRLMAAGHRVQGIPVESYWSDLGTPARYLDTVDDLLHGRAPVAKLGEDSPLHGAIEKAPGVWIRGTAHIEGAQLNGPLFIDDGARIEPGARLGPSTYVGERVRVESGTRVERSVLLAGTEVVRATQLERVVMWPGGRMTA